MVLDLIRTKKARYGLVAGVCLIAAYFVAATAVYVAQNESSTSAQYTPEQILSEGWGFNVAEGHSLIVGDPIENVQGKVKLLKSFTTPSTVQLEFRVNGSPYIVEVPVNWNPTLTNPAEARISWNLKNVVVLHDVAQCQKRGNYWLFGPCTQWSQTSVKNAKDWPEVERLGLGKFLTQYVEGVILRVTEQQYSAHFKV